VAGRLLDPITHDASLIMLIVMGVLAIAVSITLLGTPEEPTHDHPQIKLRELINQFRLNPRENPSYWWLTGERALFLLGVYGLQTFAQYYLQDVLQVPNPVRQAGTLLAAITVGVIILVLIGGWLTDKFGAKKIILTGSLLASAGLLLMMSVHNMATLTVCASVFGAGIGLFLTSNWALANQIAPQNEAGKYLGLTNLATAGAGALARLEGPLIDTLNHAYPGLWLGYLSMFAFGTICTLASVILLNRVTIKKK
jgi:MFS family permease